MKTKYTHAELLSKFGIKLNDDGKWLFHIDFHIEDEKTLEVIVGLIKSESYNSVAINLVDNSGRTALHYAAMYNNKAIAEALFERMTPECISLRDDLNNTALKYADDNHNKEVFEQLLPLTEHGESLLPLGYEPDFVEF
jgi:hypothetical protein